jgi:type IV pilus assembly protein PilB
MKKTKLKQIGQILIENNFLTQKQLDAALEIQLKEGGLLGQIFIKLGFVTQEQIEESMFEQTSSAQKLENALTELGILTAEQLQKAQAAQKKDGGFLAQIIISLGFMSEEDLVSTMVTQFGFPYLQLTNYEIDKEIVALIPQKTAQANCLIAIDKIGNILTIAMADPLNAAAQDEVRKITGLNVETFISTFSDINNVLKQYYV